MPAVDSIISANLVLQVSAQGGGGRGRYGEGGAGRSNSTAPPSGPLSFTRALEVSDSLAGAGAGSGEAGAGQGYTGEYYALG